MTTDLHSVAAAFFSDLQSQVCDLFSSIENSQSFREDTWARPGGGGGRSRVLTDGNTIEKAGVNFSDVHGEFSEEFAKNIPGDGREFTATGISLVVHPRNPFVPTVHANFRFLTKGGKQWFGGGSDLTPYYPYEEDAVHFHRTWKDACDRHPGVADHAKFKKWCDDYFYLPHRKEHRGVGGIFFDYLEGDMEKIFAFVHDCGESFLTAYLPIVKRRMIEPYTDSQREFQLFRRGRYVEFNLLYDRGTLFGLRTGGRIESILMSLPPHVAWPYDYQPEPGSLEAGLLEYLQPRDWAGVRAASPVMETGNEE